MKNSFHFFVVIICLSFFVSSCKQESLGFEAKVQYEIDSDLEEIISDSKMAISLINQITPEVATEVQLLVEQKISNNEDINFDDILINGYGFPENYHKFFPKFHTYNDRQQAAMLEILNSEPGTSEIEIYFASRFGKSKSWWGGDNDGKICGGWRPIRIIVSMTTTTIACAACFEAPPACLGCAMGVADTVNRIRSFAADGCLS